MSDKRTAGLTTIDVSVALINGLLVVDTTDLQAADDEQQKVLIKTLLDTYAINSNDFVIGDLSIKRVATTNNDTTEVLLRDSSGVVRVRDVTELLEGISAVRTGACYVDDEASESIVQSATTQQEINQQNVGKFEELEETINNITTLGAIASALGDPVPQTLLDTIQLFTWSTLFDTTNENVIELDPDNNQMILKNEGVYELDWFVTILNDQAVAMRTATLAVRDANTLTELDSAEIYVSEDGYSGTWVTRFAVTEAPQTVEFTHIADVTNDLTIESSILSIKAQNNGIPEEELPNYINVFGLDDVAEDRNNIIQAIAAADEHFTIRFFDTFNIDLSIPIDLKTNVVFDFSNATMKYTTALSTSYLFNIEGCVNCQFLSINAELITTSSITSIGIYNFITSGTQSIGNIFKGVRVSLNAFDDYEEMRILYDLYSSYTTIKDVYSTDDLSYLRANSNAIVENVQFTNVDEEETFIIVGSNSHVLKSKAGEISTSGSNSTFTNNEAESFNVNALTNILINNIGALNTFNSNLGINKVATSTYSLDVQGKTYMENDDGQVLEVCNCDMVTNVCATFRSQNLEACIVDLYNNAGTRSFIAVWDDSFLMNYNQENAMRMTANGLKINSVDDPTEALDVEGNILASGNITGENLIINTSILCNGSLDINTTAQIDGTLNVDGAVTFDSTLNVSGIITTSNLVVNTDIICNGSIDVNVNATIDGILDVYGASTINNTLSVTGELTTFAQSTGANNAGLILQGISGLGNALRYDKFGATGINESISLSHHQGGNGLRLVYRNTGGGDDHIAYFKGDNQRVGFGNAASSGDPQETVHIYGRLQLQSSTEPATPTDGIKLWNNGTVLRYKNQAGTVIELGGSSGSISLIDSTGSITFQSGSITISITKTGTGRYVVTHNLGNTNYIAMAQPANVTAQQITTNIEFITNNTFEVFVYSIGSTSDQSFYLNISY